MIVKYEQAIQMEGNGESEDYFRLKELTTEVDLSGDVLFRWITSSLNSKSQIMSTGFSSTMRLKVSLSPSSFQVPSTVSNLSEPVMLLMSLNFLSCQQAEQY